MTLLHRALRACGRDVVSAIVMAAIGGFASAGTEWFVSGSDTPLLIALYGLVGAVAGGVASFVWCLSKQPYALHIEMASMVSGALARTSLADRIEDNAEKIKALIEREGTHERKLEWLRDLQDRTIEAVRADQVLWKSAPEGWDPSRGTLACWAGLMAVMASRHPGEITPVARLYDTRDPDGKGLISVANLPQVIAASAECAHLLAKEIRMRPEAAIALRAKDSGAFLGTAAQYFTPKPLDTKP